MKLVNIEKINKVYHVTLKPNFIGRIFGKTEKVIKLKDYGTKYSCGGQTVYINQEGKKIGNYSPIAEAVDNWRRKF